MMKLRKILFPLLSAALLVLVGDMMCRRVRRYRESAARNNRETIAELKACCSRKHIRAVQYGHFAAQAAVEGMPAAAALFRAMSLSGELQERNCAAAVERLGGGTPHCGRVALFGGDTRANLRRGIRYEYASADTASLRGIRVAERSGHRRAVRLLVWAAAADVRHGELMEALLRGVTRQETGYCVCPDCGGVFPQTGFAGWCPYCLCRGERFVCFP